MDERAAQLDERARRVGAAAGYTALIWIIYFVLFIAVSSQLRTPLPPWFGVFVAPVPLLGVAMMALRYWSTWLKGDAALAQARATERSIGELEKAIDESRAYRDGPE